MLCIIHHEDMWCKALIYLEIRPLVRLQDIPFSHVTLELTISACYFDGKEVLMYYDKYPYVFRNYPPSRGDYTTAGVLILVLYILGWLPSLVFNIIKLIQTLLEQTVIWVCYWSGLS